MAVIVRVIGAADGRTVTPHDGRYVWAWTPHTRFGTLAVTSTADPAQARRFAFDNAIGQWRATSRVQSKRPDGAPNRPLTALTVEFIDVEGT